MIVNWLKILFICLLLTASQEAVSDKIYVTEDIFSKALSQKELETGRSLLSTNPLLSLKSFRRSFELYPNVYSISFSQSILDLLASPLSDHPWASSSDKVNSEKERIRQLISHHTGNVQKRDPLKALNEINDLLQIYPYLFDLHFIQGTLYVELGQLSPAIQAYSLAIQINPAFSKAYLNLGSVYQTLNLFDKAIEYYSQGIHIIKLYQNSCFGYNFIPEEYPKIMNNLALVFYQIAAPIEALEINDKLAAEFESFLNISGTNLLLLGSEPDIKSKPKKLLASIKGNTLLISRSSLIWSNWESTLSLVERSTLDFIKNCQSDSFFGPLLPFDTLLTEMSLSNKLVIAAEASRLLYKPISINTATLMKCNSEIDHLKIGMISCDFKDHPTSHLIEGIFLFFKEMQLPLNTRISIIVYSYGNNDQSLYRNFIESFATKFVDISLISNYEAVETIYSDCLDMIFEMQLHTLGNRYQITASKPSPLVINYLVYPGTSGSSFVDYITCDSVVVPPEHSIYYSEKLLLLPPTYQTSYYDKSRISNSLGNYPFSLDLKSIQIKRLMLRRLYGLPLDPDIVIFCNFNKIDKVDPNGFSIWMNILQSVPKSYLWLLKPKINQDKGNKPKSYSDQNEVVQKNIYTMANYWGINSNRIIFAERIPKSYHIERHGAADLFLDTFIYGAHSTATDSLRGGLPVLTILGESFPNRVGASLYTAMSLNSKDGATLKSIFVQDSVRGFIETAIRLTKNNLQPLNFLKILLWKKIISEKDLYNSTNHVKQFLHSAQIIKEIQTIFQASYHVIMPN